MRSTERGWAADREVDATECSLSCQRALTRLQTLWGGGALEGGNLRILEDGSKLNSAILLDEVVLETAKHGRGWGGERAGMSMGPDTKANTIWGGGALQLLEHAVPLDAARDNDSGSNVQPLAREVDLLGRLCALELVDLKRMPVDTTKGRDVP